VICLQIDAAFGTGEGTCISC